MISEGTLLPTPEACPFVTFHKSDTQSFSISFVTFANRKFIEDPWRFGVKINRRKTSRKILTFNVKKPIYTYLFFFPSFFSSILPFSIYFSFFFFFLLLKMGPKDTILSQMLWLGPQGLHCFNYAARTTLIDFPKIIYQFSHISRLILVLGYYWDITGGSSRSVWGGPFCLTSPT